MKFNDRMGIVFLFLSLAILIFSSENSGTIIASGMFGGSGIFLVLYGARK